MLNPYERSASTSASAQRYSRARLREPPHDRFEFLRVVCVVRHELYAQDAVQPRIEVYRLFFPGCEVEMQLGSFFVRESRHLQRRSDRASLPRSVDRPRADSQRKLLSPFDDVRVDARRSPAEGDVELERLCGSESATARRLRTEKRGIDENSLCAAVRRYRQADRFRGQGEPLCSLSRTTSGWTFPLS